MSLVLRQLGRRDEARGADQIALASVTRHLDLNPDDARAYSLGAGVLGRLGDVERAKQWSEQALSLASDDDAVIYNAACALAVLGETDRALDALELAIDAGLTGKTGYRAILTGNALEIIRAFRLWQSGSRAPNDGLTVSLSLTDLQIPSALEPN
jgi:tetratricopeptide (TPR) repeat protein